ncbi:hypothetical protein PBI_AN9_80 [Mycobacterium phage AN9]|nr:hypothetical protein PBI_VC3_79 [Mycobacterium phage VC3]QJD52542.1 hypothetical protein PBI_ANI8_80 [Mycobacterium phage ANI8]QJD52634.1 hypothetical protein PBI_AN9_80 [Mycobacterium phage AN9]BBC43634.1 hypothetical protein [Mycobacterium phage C3]
MDELMTALKSWKEVSDSKQAFIDRFATDGAPTCGYEAWDEALADYNDELADAGQVLADAIAEALGIKEDS